MTPTPQLIDHANTDFAQPAGIAVGGYHACVWVDGSSAACWGDSTFGQRASGDTQSLGRGPGGFDDWRRMMGLHGHVQISAGDVATCILNDVGEVRCWGQDRFGMLGIAGRFRENEIHNMGDDELDSAYPVRFVHEGPQPLARAIAAGDYHACAILETGNVQCWGKNLSGQLAIGDIEAPNDIIGDQGHEWTTIANIH
jgi:alpha-tubulin suppressor-like RCC1 family protein